MTSNLITRLLLPILLVAFSGRAVASAPVELPLPSVPSTLTEPVNRADFILYHFWDAMDWADTTLSRDGDFMELNMVNFFSVAPHASAEGVTRAFGRFASQAAADSATLRIVDEVSHRYLSEPLSPVACDEAYIAMCHALLNVYPQGSPKSVATAYLLESFEKNLPGSVATDFIFVDRQGSRRRFLESLNPEAGTILVFFDPDCHDCHELADRMRVDPGIASGIAQGRLQVIMLAPYDVEPERWQEYADTLPKDWIVGYYPVGDADFDDLYYVTAIPSVYLLAPGGVVQRRNLPGWQ